MSHAPDLGTAVLKKLQEFGDHDVERPVQSITVEQLRRIFADLLQRSKGSLRHAKWRVKRQAALKVTQHRLSNRKDIHLWLS